ncbi:MAG: hypothetical protein LBJ46_05365 [Planctomycetota bacterium]|jgi:hypothetical protein|nr:hypothetical protein [Planctomycetota bacterium]
MTPSTHPRVVGQLALGAAERRRFTVHGILDRLGRARELARLDALLFWPSGDAAVDGTVRGFCRENGVETYLWLPVFADSGFDPDPEDLVEDAWGGRGADAAGAWPGLGRGGEAFLFACPSARRHLDAVRARMNGELPLYDGAFLDRIRYPSPANGFGELFTCFCPRCREREPEMTVWRENARDLRGRLGSASDADMERWASLHALFADFDLEDFLRFRVAALFEAVRGVAGQAREMGKRVALDLFTPRLAALVGQDYSLLCSFADWVKPMSYCFARGPAGIPLELACLARGLVASGNFSPRVVMEYLRRAFAIPELPDDPGQLERGSLPPALAGDERRRAERMTTVPVLPGFECVRHPDFDFDMRAEDVRGYVDALGGAPGMAMAWNLLYTPDEFLEIVAGGRP